jgi:hypothetical protein
VFSHYNADTNNAVNSTYLTDCLSHYVTGNFA